MLLLIVVVVVVVVAVIVAVVVDVVVVLVVILVVVVVVPLSPCRVTIMASCSLAGLPSSVCVVAGFVVVVPLCSPVPPGGSDVEQPHSAPSGGI